MCKGVASTRPNLRSVIAAGFLCAASFSTSIYALESAEVTVTQALERAFQQNPELAAASWNIDIAAGAREQAGLIPNPEVSFEVEDTRSNSRSTTVQLTQPIELGGKRGARVELAERGQDAAAIKLQRSRNELRATVIQAFYSVLRAKEQVALAKESLALTERALVVANGRVKAGKVSPVEAVRAQVQLSEVRLDVRRAAMAQTNAQQQLAAVMGDASIGLNQVKGNAHDLPSLPAAKQLLTQVNQTVDLRLAEMAINQQEASLRLEQSQRIPDLNVTVGTQYDALENERVNVFGLSMPIPIFNRNQGNILSAARRADQARDLRNATELRIRTQTQLALEQWATAQEQLTSLHKTILPAAKSAVTSATRGFEMGKFSYIDVLDAQRTLLSARDQYIRSIAEATDAWVQIERIYGDISVLTSSR
ncbi:TolC family protein [Pseudomonas sp. M30-35]|uniref:TolC family protein n=1 Tax=Pseudomonas sp. M30-35 TaxID=1981174 RepID=UPI000B3CEF09